MKVLTREQLERVKQLVMAADALIADAEYRLRGAHRTHDLRFDLGWAEDGLRWFLEKLRKNAKYYDPPRTRKVERMEELERRCEMHERDNHGFPRASRKTGGPTIPGGMVPSGGKHKETQDEQGKDKTGR
jgi:hypothetical protein